MRVLRLAALAVAVLLPAALHAQASNYPAFQVPRTAEREYNIGFAGGNDARTLLFQWREGLTPISQLSLDLGVTDYDDVDANIIFVGGQYARQLARATPDIPLDFLFTVGANVGAFTGDVKPADALIRIPVGVVLGRRFVIDQALAITPFVHPRASIDFYPGSEGDDSDVAVNFDLGADLELTPRMSVRAAALLGDDDALAISLAFRPAALSRR